MAASTSKPGNRILVALRQPTPAYDLASLSGGDPAAGAGDPLRAAVVALY